MCIVKADVNRLYKHRNIFPANFPSLKTGNKGYPPAAVLLLLLERVVNDQEIPSKGGAGA